jgi:hypothetical protein
MTTSRRIFLAGTGIPLAVPAILRSCAGAKTTAVEEAHMEITRVGSKPSAIGPAE